MTRGVLIVIALSITAILIMWGFLMDIHAMFPTSPFTIPPGVISATTAALSNVDKLELDTMTIKDANGLPLLGNEVYYMNVDNVFFFHK